MKLDITLSLPWKINIGIVPIMTFIIALSGINRYHETSAELHALLQEKQKRMIERLESNLGHCFADYNCMSVSDFISAEVKSNKIAEAIFILNDEKLIHGVFRNASGDAVRTESVLPQAGYWVAEAGISRGTQKLGTVRLFVTPRYLYAELRNTLFTIIAEIVMTNIVLIFFLSAFLRKIVTGPLSFAIEGLTSCAAYIDAAANEVLSASHSLASGTFQQAESTRQTYASLTEIYELCKKNAERADRTNHLEKDSYRHIRNISNVTEQLNMSMEKITGLIRKIAEIIRNTGHADTTLQHIGFLISEAMTDIREGKDIGDFIRKAFSEVSENAVGVGSLIAEVLIASEEQVGKTEEIRKAVRSIDEVAQQNATISEQCSAASESVNDQIVQMKVFVDTLTAVVDGRFTGNR